MKKKFNYTLSTPLIWTSFDFGEVEAENEDKARDLAYKEISDNLLLCNKTLAPIGQTIGFNLDKNQIEVRMIVPTPPPAQPQMQPQVHYILFGSEAIREYNALQKPISIEDAKLFIDEGTVEQYKEGVNTPAQLLSWASGWNDWMFIDKEDFSTFIKAINDNGDVVPSSGIY